MTTSSQQVWLAKLMAYDFDIVYKKGKDNRVVNALSRMPSHKLLCLAISSVFANLN